MPKMTSPYVIKQRWRGTLEDLQYQVAVLRFGDVGIPILCVSVTGAYWSPTRKSEGSDLLALIIGGALANVHGPGRGLVVDLSELQYSGGDRLLVWRHLPSKLGQVDYPVAVVASVQNREKILSLIAYEDDPTLAGIVHASVEQACAFVASRLGHSPG